MPLVKNGKQQRGCRACSKYIVYMYGITKEFLQRGQAAVATDTSTTQLLHLRVRDHYNYRRGGEKIGRVRRTVCWESVSPKNVSSYTYEVSLTSMTA